MYAPVMEFDDGGVRSVKASGTTWITHKLNALKMMLGRFGLYIQHVENMVNDMTFKKSDVPIKMAFYIDVLTIV